ncbi:hypothetical protein [Marinomonas algarum]|uniref:Type IV pilus assembly protein PilF n=1 Tax=Marinomonas algarum TaxID=2883105 RepID=A0A9X1LDP7_9GAMM|nr:hypothetical protein [Marinomonas algarum]MCB5162807.1 hypothetical protein [Marinomonas algarum]
MRLQWMSVLLLCSLFFSACAYKEVESTSPSVNTAKRLSAAQAHILLGQWALAKAQLDRIPSEEQSLPYVRLISLYWLSVPHQDEAALVYTDALQRYPHDGFLWNNYGVLLGTQQRWHEACDAFQKAAERSVKQRQSVQINLSRCALRQDRVNLAENHLQQAKEIADLPLIGLMTELNLVLIQGDSRKARIIFNNIQADKEFARGTAHFDEYNCLSWHLTAHETDPTLYLSASNFTCLNGSRY